MDLEFEKYIALLEAITPIIDGHFEMQKDYIKCKVGCSNCCQRGYYPVTRAESKLLKIGFEKLDKILQEEIAQKAEKISKERDVFIKEGNDILKFKYACPFLIDDKCSVYEHRAIICRTQGLLLQSISSDAAVNMPACIYIGLNYANIYDEKTNCFSEAKMKELHIEVPPVALDFSYESLLEVLDIKSENLVENLTDSENDEIRMMFEWIIKF